MMIDLTIDQKLLRWYKKNGRKLPWRETTDPYKILVSELMLQQTQVSRVLLYYKKWLKQFPNWKALATATNADVIKAWAGLGYNRRALALRDIAKQYVNIGGATMPRHASGAQWPRLYTSDWLQFKGIGPYTASALAVFTRTERVMPIDTNIRRVLDRLLLGVPYPDPKLDQKLIKKSTELLKGKTFYDVPQALFDLATIICKKIPDCANCPLRDQCPSAKKFLQGSVKIPKAMVKKATETIHRNKKYPDRIYRGRILRAVREAKKPIRFTRLGPIIDPLFDPHLDNAWLEAMIKRLIHDNLLKQRKQHLRLS